MTDLLGLETTLAAPLRRIRQFFTMELSLGFTVLTAAVFYRPLTFWSLNAWDLSAPQGILITGLLELLITGVLFIIVTSTLPISPLKASFAIAAPLFVILNWDHLPGINPLWWLIGAAALTLLIALLTNEVTALRLSAVAIALWLVVPALQLVLAHIQDYDSYPVNRSDLPSSAEPTGKIEDVLVLVVDSYPMSRVAEIWFDHSNSRLTQGLERLGFKAPSISWSHNTFTSLAIPSILELSQVIDDSPKTDWRNRKEQYDIGRGASFVVSAFRMAGFEYTHIESGWNGGVCGDSDTCLHAPWFHSAISALLSPSLLDDWIKETIGPSLATSTLRTAEHLQALDTFGDGKPDFVYAHFMLPHPPHVVDPTCQFLDDPAKTTEPARVRQQLECVDSLVLEIVSGLPSDTSVLIAGDHGTSSNNQVSRPPANWTDADVAERLGAVLAYRIPAECQGPDIRTNVATMRAIVDCALTIRLPPFNQELVLGEREPLVVDRTRLLDIERRLEAGEFARQKASPFREIAPALLRANP